MAWRARTKRRASTLKNPLRICHCQGFSAKAESGPLSNTNKHLKHSVALLLTQSRNNMKEHFSHSAEDMTYVASFLVFLFQAKC